MNIEIPVLKIRGMENMYIIKQFHAKPANFLFDFQSKIIFLP